MARKTSKPNVTGKPVKADYVSVNGLEMYYEIHGEGSQPLVLIHGAFSAIGTSFGKLLPGLASNRQVIALEMQGHGHTPAGLPNSQLAILPGTSRVTVVDRADVLLSIIPAFLDAPIKEQS